MVRYINKRLYRDDNSYVSRAVLRQRPCAVTTACLLVKRSIFEAVGGLDDEGRKLAFNDVDFCLKAHGASYSNVWTPYAECYRHESVSRGFEDNLE